MTHSQYLSQCNAIEEFITLINDNDFKAIIVKDKSGNYHTQTTKTIFKDDIRVYGYGSFVNSSTERSIQAIAKHIKRNEEHLKKS